MKLQLALDVLTLKDALKLTQEVRDYIDIIEIGTPFLLKYGMDAVREFKKNFKEKKILADAKIMDAGDIEASSAFESGADYVTVLGVTDMLTVESCVKTANKYAKEIVVDMICVDDLEKKISQLEALGVHGIAVHTGVDQQKAGRQPIDDLKVMKRCCKSAKISVAGGISLATIPEYAALKPEVLIVGGEICGAKDPVLAAKDIYLKIKECESQG